MPKTPNATTAYPKRKGKRKKKKKNEMNSPPPVDRLQSYLKFQ